MRVRYLCPFAMKTGYARAAHDELLALERAGVDLDIRALGEGDTDSLEEPYQHLAKYVSELLPEDDPRQAASWPDVVVVRSIPRWSFELITGDLAPPPGIKKVCSTTWESSKLPKRDAESLDQHFDLVCVPTQWNAEVFAASGVSKKKIAVIPHCFDVEPWRKVRETPAPTKGPFVFYCALVWAERKNPIGLLKAYLSEFTGKDDVLLRILTPPVKHYVELDVQALIRAFGLHDLPKVEFITQRLTREELLAFHAASHCYVTLTRGEAWGLGSFEAALSNNDIIATDWGGHKEYLEHYPRWTPVDCFMTPAVSPEQALERSVEIGGMSIRPVGKVAPPGIAGDQDWAEPDIRGAKQAMRWRYEEWKKGQGPRRALGSGQSGPGQRLGFDWGEDKYTYENVGRKLRGVLESL